MPVNIKQTPVINMHRILRVAFLIICHEALLINGAVNYCGARMCGHTNAHTFCQYSPGPNPSCTGYIEAHLSEDEKTRILARLNKRRSDVARGVRNWPSAGDMLKLRWVEELSREAQRWADQCRTPQTPEEHDSCRDLYSISVGQCVASIVGEAPGLRPESLVDTWYMQSTVYDGNITSYVAPRHKHVYGDFAQMIWSKTYLVGCARSRFMVDWRGRLRSVERLVCNFAPRGPPPTRPLWTPAEPASICPRRSKPDPQHPGLCAYQNYVNESQPFTDDNIPIQESFVLDTIFEIERNKSLNYLGSLDELYLTKVAIATIENYLPTVPTFYFFKKRDILNTNDGNLEVIKLNITEHDHERERTTKNISPDFNFKVKVIGRPKPYNTNDLNEEDEEQKAENSDGNRVLMMNKEKDFYAEYGLVEMDEFDSINVSTTEESTQNIKMTTRIEAKLGTTDGTRTTDEIYDLEKYSNKSVDENNGTFINDKNSEDYLSEPESGQQLQEALDRMERNLVSPKPLSTPGKVRRELRNLETDVDKANKRLMTADPNILTNDVIIEEGSNERRDKRPMLKMVLNYLPYLKPYEKTIIGETGSSGNTFHFDVFLIFCCLFLYVFINM